VLLGQRLRLPQDRGEAQCAAAIQDSEMINESLATFSGSVRASLSGRLRPAGAGNNIASRARLWLARLPRRSPHTRHPRSVDLQFAESGSSAPAWSATDPACLSAQSSANSATSSHPSMAGSRCGPSNSTISVTVLDL
jgi:hypothetical protein